MKPKQKQTESKLESQKLEANCVEMGRYFNRLQESDSILHQMRMLGKKKRVAEGVHPQFIKLKSTERKKRVVFPSKPIFIKNKIGLRLIIYSSK